MLTSLAVALLSLAALAVCFFLGEELDLRHHHPATTWIPPFVPIFVIVLGGLLVAGVRGALEWRRRAPDRPRRPLVDAVADAGAFLLVGAFFYALVVALNQSDDPAAEHPWAAFGVAELLFYIIFACFAIVTLVGTVRTSTEHRRKTNGAPLAFCPGETDEPTRATYDRTRYQDRALYENNKLVFLLSLELLPNVWIDGLHIVLLVLHALGCLVTGSLVFLRLRQIASIAPVTLSAQTRLAGLNLPSVGQLGHVIYSLADWRGNVIPMGVVFIPLFITQGLLLLFAVPQAFAYFRQNRPIVDWLQGIAYWLWLAMAIVFEALLAARVDSGVLDNASWHNTLAPLYAAFALSALLVGFTAVGAKSQCGTNRWGLVD